MEKIIAPTSSDKQCFHISMAIFSMKLPFLSYYTNQSTFATTKELAC
jgi:hypothetical protein